MSTNTDITLAYRPQEFMDLGVTIAQWAANREIFASYPRIVENKGRWYFLFSFGHCPETSGYASLIAWDDLNEVYLMWNEDMEGYDFDIPLMENAEILNGDEFSSLDDITKYVLTGDK